MKCTKLCRDCQCDVMVPIPPTDCIVSSIFHTGWASQEFFHNMTLANMPCTYTFPTGSLLDIRSVCTSSLSSTYPMFPCPSEHKACWHVAVLSALTCPFSLVLLKPLVFLIQLKTVLFIDVFMNKFSLPLILFTHIICYSQTLVFIDYLTCASWSSCQQFCSKVLVWEKSLVNAQCVMKRQAHICLIIKKF